MRSVEFYTIAAERSCRWAPQPSRFKLIVWWQAVAFPGATCVEDSREVQNVSRVSS
jgi:hypothetical protein